MTVTLYTKPDCPLCDHAKEVIAQVRAEVQFEVEEINILTNPELYERFRYDIPVIFVDGHKAFKHRIEARSLRRRLSSGVS